MMNNLKLSEKVFKPVFPVDDLVLSIFKECTPRILVVTDGFLSYGAGDFGLSDFINTLRGTVIHGMMPIVETAHRGGSPADFTNFTFTAATLSKSRYDVLFMFGALSFGSLPAAEISVISDFMDDGGGVFATGDHANLGRNLCGNIPRVKGMRRWTGPSASSANRLSTNDPGVDNTFQFDDQADGTPQKIYPAYKGTSLDSSPHVLLQHPTKKVIEVLPDHPHESECTIPNNLGDVAEWPQDNLGQSVNPELVALSMSYGGGFISPNKQPISIPRSFGAIAAYDGHLANVGRISTDATWHHFININLINTGSGIGLAANPDAYDRVNTYFGNIANWLMPKRTRRCLRWPFLLTARQLYPVAEFIPDVIDKPLDLPDLLELGQQMQSTLSHFIVPGQQQELVSDLINTEGKNLSQKITSLSKESTSVEDLIAQRLNPVELFEQVTLGVLTQTVATAFPVNDDLKACLKKVGGIEGLNKQTDELIEHTYKELCVEIRNGNRRLDKILASCS